MPEPEHEVFMGRVQKGLTARMNRIENRFDKVIGAMKTGSDISPVDLDKRLSQIEGKIDKLYGVLTEWAKSTAE